MKILKPCDTKEAEKYLNTKVMYADKEENLSADNVGILRFINDVIYKDTPYFIEYMNHDKIHHSMISPIEE